MPPLSLLPEQTVLIVIDVQKAFDEMEAAGNRRNNPDAVARIAELLEAFRRSKANIRLRCKLNRWPGCVDRLFYAARISNCSATDGVGL
jgi:hypothetical protein